MDDTTQFQEVYQAHFRFVWRALRRLGVDERDVPDAIQDVFLVVHRKLDSWEGRSKMSTWLFGICMRVASDRRRSAYLRREIPVEHLVDRPDVSQDTSCRVERHQRLALLKTLLDALPIEQSTVFVLFEVESMSGEEIAEVLRLPTGTVYSRLRLAREGVRKELRRLQARDAFDAENPERQS